MHGFSAGFACLPAICLRGQRTATCNSDSLGLGRDQRRLSHSALNTSESKLGGHTSGYMSSVLWSGSNYKQYDVHTQYRQRCMPGLKTLYIFHIYEGRNEMCMAWINYCRVTQAHLLTISMPKPNEPMLLVLFHLVAAAAGEMAQVSIQQWRSLYHGLRQMQVSHRHEVKNRLIWRKSGAAIYIIITVAFEQETNFASHRDRATSPPLRTTCF